MVLSKEEKLKRNREAARRYRAKKAQKIKSGDPKATAQAKKDVYNTLRSKANKFVNIAAKKDLLILRDRIAERQKKLK